MRKVKTVFVINRETDLATNVVQPGSEWVLNGEGVATLKVDGTSAAFINGQLYKRWDRKLQKRFVRKSKRSDFIFDESMLKPVPEGAIPCEPSYDPVTYHQPHWVPVSNTPENKHFIEALSTSGGLIEGKTYEMVGPKIQGNLYNLERHELIQHGIEVKEDIELTFDGIRQWLLDNNAEGIVFHHPDGRMAKVRRKDMFEFHRLDGGRKIDWRDENIVK